MALAASEDLQKSENAYAQAGLDRKIAFSGFLPAFDASASAVFVAPDTEMSGMELIMRGTYLAGITLTQPLYAGGKIVAGHRLAKMGQGLGTAMLSFSVPIFKWGQNYNKVRKAKIDVDNALLDLQKNEKLLTLEANQASMNLNDSYMLLETAEAAMAEADENLRVMKNRYDASMATLSDLLEAQSQWHQSHSNLIEAITQTRICVTDYLRATGKLVTE
ncbi:MAG: TolC family protein [Candidatus Cryptobacteroides sp.]